jgi:hypothetical protein
MLRFLILCVTLAGCFGREADPSGLRPTDDLADPAPLADPALFRTCPGWTGGPPETGTDLVLAAEAEIACGDRMRGQLIALAEIYGVAQ